MRFYGQYEVGEPPGMMPIMVEADNLEAALAACPAGMHNHGAEVMFPVHHLGHMTSEEVFEHYAAFDLDHSYLRRPLTVAPDLPAPDLPAPDASVGLMGMVVSAGQAMYRGTHGRVRPAPPQTRQPGKLRQVAGYFVQLVKDIGTDGKFWVTQQNHRLTMQDWRVKGRLPTREELDACRCFADRWTIRVQIDQAAGQPNNNLIQFIYDLRTAEKEHESRKWVPQGTRAVDMSKDANG